jgi:hypothetical protein
MSHVNFYNAYNALIETPKGPQYGGISAWQGIRYLGSNIYLICGTTNPNPNAGYGLIYIGNINCINGKFYYLNVPNDVGVATSVYGPNYDSTTGIYTFVGSYTNYNYDIKGFVYTGTLDGLENPDNFKYPNVNSTYNTTFLHSNSNGLIVGNSGNKINTISYIYDINNLSEIKTQIMFPNSKTTTTYGIWYNGNNSYTIVGGYSFNFDTLELIHLPNGIINTIGSAFIVDYNSETNTFSNWTSINYKNDINSFLTHFQGIYGNEDGTYSLNADVINLAVSPIPQGYFLTISRNNNNEFISNFENWIKINYDENNGITSSNSVANNMVIGLFIGEQNVSYQCEIINEIEFSKSNILLSNIKNNHNILFNNTFINSKLIKYENTGVIKFLEKGTYFLNFNIYIENTKLAAVIFEIKYTINTKKYSFNVAQKGIDEIGTGTAHSLVIPCSFISEFNIGDTIEITNISGDTVSLISNYVVNATNSIISITKLS